MWGGGVGLRLARALHWLISSTPISIDSGKMNVFSTWSDRSIKIDVKWGLFTPLVAIVRFVTLILGNNDPFMLFESVQDAVSTRYYIFCLIKRSWQINFQSLLRCRKMTQFQNLDRKTPNFVQKHHDARWHIWYAIVGFPTDLGLCRNKWVSISSPQKCSLKPKVSYRCWLDAKKRCYFWKYMVMVIFENIWTQDWAVELGTVCKDRYFEYRGLGEF